MKRIAPIVFLLALIALFVPVRQAKADYGLTSLTITYNSPTGFDTLSAHSTGTYTGSKEVRVKMLQVVDYYGSGMTFLREDISVVYDTTTTPASPFDFYSVAHPFPPTIFNGPTGTLSGEYYYTATTYIRDASTHNVTWQSNSIGSYRFFNN